MLDPARVNMLFYRDRERPSTTSVQLHFRMPETSFSEARVQRNSEWVTFAERLLVVLDVPGQALALILSQHLGYIHSLIMIGSTELNHPDREIRRVGLQSARAQTLDEDSGPSPTIQSRKLSGE